MALTLPFAAATLSGTAIAAASHVHNPAWPIAYVAGTLGGLALIYRTLHLGEIFRGIVNFLRDYNGEEARPGHEARPGLPERLSLIEAQTHEIKGAMPTIAVGLETVHDAVVENGSKTDRVDQRVVHLDDRVTDHRRRNEEQSKILSDELKRRYDELDRKLRDRDASVDARFDALSDDLLRAETMRAVLIELGVPIEPHPRNQTPDPETP